ncbi:hypothetical protein AVEN_100274-1 [Araneus ventricosus]|uniref:Uncharacterized protein n=1 Tax=Araneus ventricosus TaxID=182803 RepID=A0A4Y2X617_ARAVE|nr:hypothetical protein AVEN_100274-1 [Araneus ventricosus]
MPTPVPWPAALDYAVEDPQPDRGGPTDSRLGLNPVSLLARGVRPWCTTCATPLILDSAILPCTVYFYHGGKRTVHKISRFRNASTLGPKANNHALLDVGYIATFLHYDND